MLKMFVFSNNPGDTLNFMLYDFSEDTMYQAANEMIFQANATKGTFIEPYIFTTENEEEDESTNITEPGLSSIDKVRLFPTPSRTS